MFKTLEIQNFQSHEKTRLELHPGINAIVGDSDKGKSATLRALLWAATNRPSGDAHISDWCRTKSGGLKKGSGARVTLTDATGTCTRVRTGDVNGYEVNGILCEAVRTDVPEEAAAFFNLGEVNIQRQTDPPFLLASSAGEVARFFNRIIKLEEIDKTLSMAESRRRATNAETRTLESDITEAEQKLEGLGWVDSYADAVGQAELHERALAEKTQKISELRTAIADWQRAREIVERLSILEAARGYISKAYKTQQATKESIRCVNELGSALPRWQEAAQDARRVRELALAGPAIASRIRKGLDALKTAQAARYALERQLCEYTNAAPHPEVAGALVGAADCFARARKLHKRIDMKTLGMDGISRELISHQVETERIYDLRAELKGLVASLPPTCPTCGQTWNRKHSHG